MFNDGGWRDTSSLANRSRDGSGDFHKNRLECAVAFDRESDFWAGRIFKGRTIGIWVDSPLTKYIVFFCHGCQRDGLAIHHIIPWRIANRSALGGCGLDGIDYFFKNRCDLAVSGSRKTDGKDIVAKRSTIAHPCFELVMFIGSGGNRNGFTAFNGLVS